MISYHRADILLKYAVVFCRSTLHAALAMMLCAVFVQDANSAPPPPSTLTIEDPSQGVPAITTTSEDFHQRWLVKIDALKDGAPLWIQSAGLSGPDGVAAKLGIHALDQIGNPLTVTPKAADYEAVEIDLSAKLERVGEYTGLVKLRYGDEKLFVKPIHVSRTMIDLPVKALGVERVLNENCWVVWSCWREATVWLTLQQVPPERELTVTPTLTEFALNRVGKEKVQAGFDSLIFSAEGKAMAQGIALKPGDSKRLGAKLAGLDETGEYAGKLSFASPGYKAVEQPFTVLVKDSWLIALIPILLGAMVSMWLRRYGSDQRPRLVARQRIATLGEQIDALRGKVGQLDEAENRVLNALNQQLTALYGAATSSEALPEGWIASTQAALQTIAAKLLNFSLWANARRSLAGLDPAVDKTAIQATIAEIQIALESEADLSDAQKASLLGLTGQITNLRQKAVVAEADALRSELAEFGKIAGSEHLLDSGLAEANAKLADVERYANAGEFVAARSAYEGAQKIFANWLIDDFAARVALGVPVGLEPDKWAKLKPQIEPLLAEARTAMDAKGAMAGYAQAYRLYLNAQITELLPRLSGDSFDFKVQKLAPKLQQGFREDAKKTENNLREAAAALVRGELRLACAKQKEALDGWRALNNTLSPTGDRMGGAGAGEPGTADVAPAAALPPDASQAVTLLPTVFVRVAENASELFERTKAMDYVVDILAIAFSALLGVQYVWGPNPTWGGLADWITALLWGLGLHQVSGYTFEGVLGLRDKLLKK